MIAESENLSSLQSLELTFNSVGDQGCVDLARSPYLQGLKYLGLSHNSIKDEGCVAIANAFPALEELSLFNNSIGDRGLTALAHSKTKTNLRRLLLSENAARNGTPLFQSESLVSVQYFGTDFPSEDLSRNSQSFLQGEDLLQAYLAEPNNQYLFARICKEDLLHQAEAMLPAK